MLESNALDYKNELLEDNLNVQVGRRPQVSVISFGVCWTITFNVTKQCFSLEAILKNVILEEDL